MTSILSEMISSIGWIGGESGVATQEFIMAVGSWDSEVELVGGASGAFNLNFLIIRSAYSWIEGIQEYTPSGFNLPHFSLYRI